MKKAPYWGETRTSDVILWTLTTVVFPRLVPRLLYFIIKYKINKHLRTAERLVLRMCIPIRV